LAFSEGFIYEAQHKGQIFILAYMRKRIKALNYIVGLIDRYEKGTANDTERRALDTWMPDSKAIIKNSPNRKALTEFNAKVWHALVRQYRMEDNQSEKKPAVIRHIWHTYRRYAAIVTVVFITGSASWLLFNHSHYLGDKTMQADARKAWTTDNTHRTTLTLPDGTVVQVNAGSRFEIAETAFNKQKREVWLTGEAFFEVAKNKKKPFIIHTGNMQTTVRGTSFNVKAYPQLGENVISVRNGRVEISENKKLLGVLTANRQLRYNSHDHTALISNADWQDAAGWREGRLVLNGVGIEELKLRLRQQFGVEVIVERQAINGKYLQGAFGSGCTLTQVMNTISAIYNIHYTTDGSRIIITP
jgi:transmembrane sensor